MAKTPSLKRVRLFLLCVTMISCIALAEESPPLSEDKPMWERMPVPHGTNCPPLYDAIGRVLTPENDKEKMQYFALYLLPGMTSAWSKEWRPERTAKHLKWAAELFDFTDPSDRKVLDNSIDMPVLVEGVPVVLNLYGSEGLLWVLEKYPSSPVVRKFNILKVLAGFRMQEVYRLLERELDNQEGAPIPQGGEEQRIEYYRMCDGAHNALRTMLRDQALELGCKEISGRVPTMRISPSRKQSADKMISDLKETLKEERVREMIDSSPSMLKGLDRQKRERAKRLLSKMKLIEDGWHWPF